MRWFIVGLGVAGIGLALSTHPVIASVVTLNPIVSAQRTCNIASGRCSEYASDLPATDLLIGGVQQGLAFTGGIEFDLSSLTSGALLTSAALSIGAYSRYGVTDHQGFQDGAIGTVNLTAYLGNGVFDVGDADHRGTVNITLAHAAVTHYDVTGLLRAFQASQITDLGFSIYQTPVGVCGYGTSCEINLTGDTVPFAFDKPPQLILTYADPVPDPPPVVTVPPASPTIVPEPSTWGMLLTVLGMVGLAQGWSGRKSVVQPS